MKAFRYTGNKVSLEGKWLRQLESGEKIGPRDLFDHSKQKSGISYNLQLTVRTGEEVDSRSVGWHYRVLDDPLVIAVLETRERIK